MILVKFVYFNKIFKFMKPQNCSQMSLKLLFSKFVNTWFVINVRKVVLKLQMYINKVLKWFGIIYLKLFNCVHICQFIHADGWPWTFQLFFSNKIFPILLRSFLLWHFSPLAHVMTARRPFANWEFMSQLFFPLSNSLPSCLHVFINVVGDQELNCLLLFTRKCCFFS